MSHDDPGDGPDIDPKLVEGLREALNHDPDRAPSPERIAALRDAVERRATSNPSSGQMTAAAGTDRRRLLFNAAAASVGALVGGAVVLAVTDDDGTDDSLLESIAFRPSGPDTAGTVERSGVIPHTWGTELVLDVRDLAPGTSYEIVYRTAADETLAAGSFVAVADVLMKCRFNGAVVRSEVTQIAIIDHNGQSVMTADLA